MFVFVSEGIPCQLVQFHVEHNQWQHRCQPGIFDMIDRLNLWPQQGIVWMKVFRWILFLLFVTLMKQRCYLWFCSIHLCLQLIHKLLFVVFCCCWCCGCCSFSSFCLHDFFFVLVVFISFLFNFNLNCLFGNL